MCLFSFFLFFFFLSLKYRENLVLHQNQIKEKMSVSQEEGHTSNNDIPEKAKAAVLVESVPLPEGTPTVRGTYSSF